MADIRVTVAVAAVLKAFLDEPGRPRYGYDLMTTTDFASGKIYPILSRLHSAGWLTKERVDGESGGPPRYLYRLTGLGQESARQELAALSQQFAPRSPSIMNGLSPQGGIA